MLDQYDGETAVSGEHEGTLLLRGYRLADLIAHASYDDAAFLLLQGRLPTAEERKAFTARVLACGAIDNETRSMLDSLRETIHPIDAIALGLLRDALIDRQVAHQSCEYEQMLGRMISILATIARVPTNLASTSSIAAALVPAGEHAEIRRRLIDRVLIAYADNEWNSSTYAARIIASTRSDLPSAILGGISALKGSLHGGANEAAFHLLMEVDAPGHAETFVRNELARKRRFMGFGHRRFRDGDPRAIMLRSFCEEAARDTGNERLEAIAVAIEGAILSATGLRPNIDWPCARMLHYARFDPALFTPIFAAARTAGWCAHVREERTRNRLISPQARYTGPSALEWPAVRD